MPKIVIKEYDETKPGFVAGNNFSVVVPGFVKDGYRVNPGAAYPDGILYGYDDDNKSVFDENGIYVCSSKADFEKYIGKVPAQGSPVVAVGPTLERDDTTITAEQFYVTYKDQVYIKTAAASEADQYIGKLHSYDDGTYYVFSKVTEPWNDSATYSVILAGKEGQDALEGNFQYGNQIADFLLSLGYTVLYVKLDTISDLTAAKFKPLLDRSIYDFRYLISGLIDDCGGNVSVSAVNAILNEIAQHVNTDTSDDNGRGDCIALLDVAKSAYAGQPTSQAIASIKGAASGGSAYSAFFAPVVYYGGMEDPDYNKNNEFPASVHYLACAASAANNYPEWFAISGYTRGVSSYKVVGTGVKLGDAAVNALQKRSGDGGAAINLIINLNGNYYLWGNRTAYPLSNELVASHFLNIRQICTTLKKAIYTTCRNLTFEPNSDILWLNFCNSIRPVLEKMKGNQGIKDYRFERKDTSLKAKLFAAVRIVPIEAVEDFEIGITLEDEIGEGAIDINEYLAG